MVQLGIIRKGNFSVGDGVKKEQIKKTNETLQTEGEAMKKLFIILLSLCIVLSSCGGTEKKDESNKDNVSEKTSDLYKENNYKDKEEEGTEISEFENYKNKCLDAVSDLEYSDESTEEVLETLIESYSEIKSLRFGEIEDSESESGFVLGVSYLSKKYDDGTIGFEISKAGWEAIEALFYGQKEKYNKKMKEFKTIWNSNMDKKLYNESYKEGQYKVGKDIPSGEYVFFSDGSGYFCVSSDANGDNIIANDNFDYNSIMKIKKGDYLELSGCYAVPIKEAKIEKRKATMLKVGKHIKQGEYKIVCENGEEGYYCIYTDSRQQNIKSNDNFKKQSYVNVKNGEYLLLSRCHIK